MIGLNICGTIMDRGQSARVSLADMDDTMWLKMAIEMLWMLMSEMETADKIAVSDRQYRDMIKGFLERRYKLLVTNGEQLFLPAR